MENWAYHIQLLLEDELDKYKDKENTYTDKIEQLDKE